MLNCHGLIQVYTGDGKGKTTAALGLALRAVGQGLKVYMIQFLKPAHLSSGEIKISRKFKPGLAIKRLNTPWWSLKSFSNDKDKTRMRVFLKNYLFHLEKIIASGKYDLIILDEINNCLHFDLIEKNKFIKIIQNKASSTEIILTGRNAPGDIIDMADLVTEMKMVKHPFTYGKKAKKGIEY